MHICTKCYLDVDDDVMLPDIQSRVITKVHDLLGQPSYTGKLLKQRYLYCFRNAHSSTAGSEVKVFESVYLLYYDDIFSINLISIFHLIVWCLREKDGFILNLNLFWVPIIQHETVSFTIYTNEYKSCMNFFTVYTHSKNNYSDRFQPILYL